MVEQGGSLCSDVGFAEADIGWSRAGYLPADVEHGGVACGGARSDVTIIAVGFTRTGNELRPNRRSRSSVNGSRILVLVLVLAQIS